jgi:hypothetical protein
MTLEFGTFRFAFGRSRIRIGCGTNLSAKISEKARNVHTLSIYSIEAEIRKTSAIELARVTSKPTHLRETDIFTLSRAKETFTDSCLVMSAKQAVKHLSLFSRSDKQLRDNA